MTDDELILHIVKLWKKQWDDPDRYQMELIECFGSIYLGDIFSYDFETLHNWYKEWKSWHSNDELNINDYVLVREKMTKKNLYSGIFLGILPTEEPYAGSDFVIKQSDGDIEYCYEGFYEFCKIGGIER